MRGGCGPVTCVFAAMHLQVGQLEVALGAAGVGTHKRAFGGVHRAGHRGRDARHPSDVLHGEGRTDGRTDRICKGKYMARISGKVRR